LGASGTRRETTRGSLLGVGLELHVLDAPLDELTIERADHRTALSQWMSSPITRGHVEELATIVQPPDEGELLLFDEPVVQF